MFQAYITWEEDKKKLGKKNLEVTGKINSAQGDGDGDPFVCTVYTDTHTHTHAI